MARYKVRSGAVLPHNGELLEGGTFVRLPRHVGEDPIVRDLVQEVDEAGELVEAAPVEEDLARFRPHERLSLLQQRLAAAQARVATLEEQIAAEQHTIEETAAPVASSPLPEHEE